MQILIYRWFNNTKSKNSSINICDVSFKSGLIEKCEDFSPLRITYIAQKYFRTHKTPNRLNYKSK